MRYLLVLLSLVAFGCAPQTPQGSEGPEGDTGPIGLTGAIGTQGAPGAPGSSCTVSQTDMGALIQCPDGTSAVVLHGKGHHHHYPHCKKKCK